MVPAEEHSVARNLGAFFGHIARAISSDASGRRAVRIKRSVQESRAEDGVVLRRTTVDEVLLPPGQPPPRPPSD
jgi:hypothetical protein